LDKSRTFGGVFHLIQMCDFLEELLQKEIFGGYTKRKENKW
jgi:hypothetical protein